MKPYFNNDMLVLLRQVHINMPYKVMPQYLEMALNYRFNLEIGFEAADFDRVPRSELLALARQLERNHCRTTVHGPFWDLCPGSLDPAIRQVSYLRLQQLFDILDIFQPLQVVCHTGFDPRHHRGYQDVWMDHSVNIWEAMVKRAAAMKIPLLLENVWEHGPELFQELFGRIDSPFFGFCLDAGHQHSFSQTPLPEWLESLSGVLREIHVHDNDGSEDAHLPVGQGSIDFVLLFDFLREREISPLLTLEPHSDEHLPLSLSGLKEVMTARGPVQPGRSFAGGPAGRSAEGTDTGERSGIGTDRALESDVRRT